MLNGTFCNIGGLVAGMRAVFTAISENYKYSLTIILLSVHQLGFAFEPYQSFPNARAAAMAGVFLAQADDSSAIWYNPAGLNRQGGVNSDYTIELAALNRGKVLASKVTGDRENNASHAGKKNALRYAAAYGKNFPWGLNRSNSMDTGIAYVSLFRMQLDVDAPQSPINPNPFGLIDVHYQQLSWLLGYRLNPEVSIAATLDALWGSINCLQFEPCVSNSPVGPGYSLGFMLGLRHSPAYSLRLGARLRSRARPEYGSTPDSGIGTVLEDYLPARPASYAMGVNLQMPGEWGVVNMNVEAELIRWSAAASKRLPLPDYTNTGISAEWLFALKGESSWALRTGYRQSSSDDERLLPDFRLFGLGGGYLFAANQAVDLSWEQRELDNKSSETVRAISLSYSLQF